MQDLSAIINKSEQPGFGNWLCTALTCLTGVGAIYMCRRVGIVPQGSYGFALNSGKYELVLPGWYALPNPLQEYLCTKNAGEDIIQVGPVTIVRVNNGFIGLALSNGLPELLLPGIHARRSGTFKFKEMADTAKELIDFGPVKIFTVKSGYVQVCYSKGKIQVFSPGRYGVNDGTFVVSSQVTVTQEPLRFSKHPVLLDGGINLLVEGLLNYKVVNVELLIRQLGEGNLERALTDVTKAELARVFASVHLEQISTAQAEPLTPDEMKVMGITDAGEREGRERARICEHVLQFVRPIVQPWGVSIICFQLESTSIADVEYAKQYEFASLNVAKVKANLRSVEMENEIRLRKAQAVANAAKIEAGGLGEATLTEARAQAECVEIDADSRNAAGELMSIPFAQQMALAEQRVTFAKSLKATNVNILAHDSAHK